MEELEGLALQLEKAVTDYFDKMIQEEEKKLTRLINKKKKLLKDAEIGLKKNLLRIEKDLDELFGG